MIMHFERAWLSVILTLSLGAESLLAAPIDRQAVVARHAVEVRRFDAQNPLSVGNGEFAFTVDATGLQTFPNEFTDTTPLGTLADWGWHTMPNPEGWSWDRYPSRHFPTCADDWCPTMMCRITRVVPLTGGCGPIRNGCTLGASA